MIICRNHAEVGEGVRRCARCMNPFCGDCLVDIAGRPYCADCKQEQLLDVMSGIDRTHLNLASNSKRFAALVLDSLLTRIPILVLFGIYAFTPVFAGRQVPFAWNFAGLVAAFVSFLYEGFMMQARPGLTLGKMALKIQVVNADGSQLGTSQAWKRAGFKMIFGFCLSFINYLPALFTQERTTLHDMVANTRVIETY